MAGSELMCASNSLATPFEMELTSKSSQYQIYFTPISVLFKIFPFCMQSVYCSTFQSRNGADAHFPTQSDLLLVTCYLSFSSTAWKMVHSRASSQAKASGNRLRHALHTDPLYLHSPLQWDSFSLSFPRPLLHYVKSLCVLSHPFRPFPLRV